MCYHCATNPSIHHRCRRVATVSLPLSHYGVTFTVTSSWFRRCHCDVAFIIALLWCRCHSHIVAVPWLSHCCSFVVAVMVSPSSSHCRGFVVAVVVSPSHLLWFCCRCCGVAFMSVMVSLLPSRCCLRRCIVMVSLSSRCCLHCRIVAVSSSQFRRRHYGVAFVVSLSWCHHCSRVVAVPLLSHRCGFIVAVAMSPSSSHCRGVHCHFIIAVMVLPSSLHRHGVVIAVLLSLLRCRFCCCIVVTSRCHCCSHVVAWLWLWLWSWSHHGHGHHGRGCGCVVVVTIVVASLWLSLLRCGR